MSDFIPRTSADHLSSLTVSLAPHSSGRHLVHHLHPIEPFFYLGDTAWEVPHRLDDVEAETYLRNRAEKGFNVVMVVLLAEHGSVAFSRSLQLESTDYLVCPVDSSSLTGKDTGRSTLFLILRKGHTNPTLRGRTRHISLLSTDSSPLLQVSVSPWPLSQRGADTSMGDITVHLSCSTKPTPTRTRASLGRGTLFIPGSWGVTPIGTGTRKRSRRYRAVETSISWRWWIMGRFRRLWREG